MFVDIVNMSYMACDLGFTGGFHKSRQNWNPKKVVVPSRQNLEWLVPIWIELSKVVQTKILNFLYFRNTFREFILVSFAPNSSPNLVLEMDDDKN